MGLFKSEAKNIGIDLGTSTILIALEDKGIILKEPSILAVDRGSLEVLAIGNEAKVMLEKTPQNIKQVNPIAGGVISDHTMALVLLKKCMEKITKRHKIKDARAIANVPTNITEVEQRAIKDVLLNLGLKEVYLIESPISAALGAGINISEPNGNLIVDIGGGVTEACVLSLGGIVVQKAIKVAGNKINESIIGYFKIKENIAISDTMAEKIKIEIGQMIPHTNQELTIKGRDLDSGMPREIIIDHKETRKAVTHVVDEIIEAIMDILEQTPPELASDIAKRGIYLTGGGSLIKGLDQLITKKTGIQTFISNNPIDCVVLGTLKTFENIDNMQDVSQNKKRR